MTESPTRLKSMCREALGTTKENLNVVSLVPKGLEPRRRGHGCARVPPAAVLEQAVGGQGQRLTRSSKGGRTAVWTKGPGVWWRDVVQY